MTKSEALRAEAKKPQVEKVPHEQVEVSGKKAKA